MKINLREIPIYYINLPEHRERDTAFLEKMKSAGFEESKIFRIEGIRKEGSQHDPVYVGCFHSQLKTLKQAISGPLPFMILEDDCEINQIPDYIDVPENSDAVYLGISAWGFSPSQSGNLALLNSLITDRVDQDVVRIFNMLSSHAILYVAADYVQSLITDLESNLSGQIQISNNSGESLLYHGGTFLPCDIIMANKQYLNNVYALRNPVFYQGDKHTYCTLFKI